MGAGRSREAQADACFVADEAADCRACTQPCEDHARLPDYLKIAWSEPQEGSFGKPYGKHLVVCSHTHDWPARILDAPDSFAHRLNHEVNDVLGKQLPWRVVVTASDEASLPVELVGGAIKDPTEDYYDVYVFPDMLRVRSVSDSRAVQVARLLLGEPPRDLLVEPVEFKWYVAVCTHGTRDKRCGVAGPMIVDEFHNQLDKYGLQDSVRVAGSSHIGGHKFAGTCIIYPDGDWFGKLTPCDVQNVVEQYHQHGRVIRSRWRGRPPVVQGFPDGRELHRRDAAQQASHRTHAHDDEVAQAASSASSVQLT